jgi:hypothetical protein
MQSNHKSLPWLFSIKENPKAQKKEYFPRLVLGMTLITEYIIGLIFYRIESVRFSKGYLPIARGYISINPQSDITRCA